MAGREPSHQSHQKPQPKGLYKVTIHARRREGMSEEDFHRHWTNEHSVRVSEWLKQHGIIGYSQYHTPSWVRSEASEKLKTLGGFATQNMADFDGYVELRMPDIGCFERARKDPYYKDVVEPDEKSFFDFSSSLLTVGWEETYVDASKGGELAESVIGNSPGA